MTSESVFYQRGYRMSVHEHREERRAQIKQAALQLFATKGYENTKVSTIVQSVNVSQGTFYWYFASKEECAIEMLDEGRAQMIALIQKGYRTQSFAIQDAIASTQTMFEHIFKVAEEHPYLMQILFRGIYTQPVLQQRVEDIKKDMEQAFAKNIERAKELGVLSNTLDAQFHALLIMSLLSGVLSRWLFRDEVNDVLFHQKTVQQIIKETVQFEFYGLFGSQLKGDINI